MLALVWIQTKIDYDNLFVLTHTPIMGHPFRASLTCIRILALSWVREVRSFVSATGLGLLILVGDQANKRHSCLAKRVNEPDVQLHRFFLIQYSYEVSDTVIRHIIVLHLPLGFDFCLHFGCFSLWSAE